jgi:soluble lytic murein transglycosylase-like protein
LEHILRIGTLVVAAVFAVFSTSLSPAQHRPHPLPRPSHAPAISLPVVAQVGPPEAAGRVVLWQNQRLLAAEAPPPAPPRPATRPPGAPAPPPVSYGSGVIQDIITKAFTPYGPAAVAWGLRVAHCESGFNPRAYNPAGPYYGLFQFLMSTFRATPYGSGDIYDPVANANAAAWKFANGGARAWGCS